MVTTNGLAGRDRKDLRGLKEIAGYLGVSEPTARQLIEKQSLPAAKLGREWISDSQALDEWRSGMLKTPARHRREVR